jgi:hypothetical protein
MFLPLLRTRMLANVVRDPRRALDEFYRTMIDCEAFVEPGNHLGSYRFMESLIDQLLQDNGRLRVLEYGGGRTILALPVGARRFDGALSPLCDVDERVGGA